MRIYHHLNEFVPPSRTVVTIGTFDGVHSGHQKILKRLREIAQSINGEVVMLTFFPHPRKVLGSDAHLLRVLSTMDEKTHLLEKAGVDHLIIHPFSKEFSMMGYEDFVKKVLVDSIKVNTLVIGYDHQFGHQRKGNLKSLEILAKQYGFGLEEIPEHDIDAIAVSSTRIRKALERGEVEAASQLLGYDYMFTGRVVKGNQIGRKLGFPTANLVGDDPDKLIPANGIYAVWVECKGTKYKGALSIGHRPTFDNGNRTIEVHILEFDEMIYGENVTLYFKNYIRPEEKFDSAEELIAQMNRDVERCYELLAN